MSESESDALPLGDAPIFSTGDIIADNREFVNRFLEKSWNFFKNIFLGKTAPRGGEGGTVLVFPLEGLFSQLVTGIFFGMLPNHLQKVAEDIL